MKNINVKLNLWVKETQKVPMRLLPEIVKVFVADKLSQNNKNQLDCLGVEWVELRSTNGYLRFGTVLNNLGIPHKNINSFDDEDLEKIFNHIFTNI